MKLLFAPLDWGLGHTTRSVPILLFMKELGWEIVIACSKTQKKILLETLPDARFLDLEGYKVVYGTSRSQTFLRLFLQIPRLLSRITSEHREVQQMIRSERPNLLISDNRYGFYSRSIPSCLITHQLTVRSGLGRWLDPLVNVFHRRLIRRFSSIWIPDVPDKDRLAGALSIPEEDTHLPPCYFLGGLSRFKKTEVRKKNGLILLLLSGPEPQRTLLEEILLRQLPVEGYQFIMVRGVPEQTATLSDRKGIQFYNHLPTSSLEKLLGEAEWVISRAGYSSIMDYLKTGCRALLIPTPGQAEQEYLAEYVEAKKWALWSPQEGFDLAKIILRAKDFPFTPAPPGTFEKMEVAIQECLRDNELITSAKSNFEKRESE